MSTHTNKSLMLACFVIGLIFYGAVPFYTTPTLGQAVGSTIGWAQSFINDGWFSLYSKNFGYPEPAARSFGLMGVLTASIFMRAGLHGADAYTMMTIVWLGVAFFAAYRIARHFGATSAAASLLALLWLSMPVITAHSGYSMLSLGIALLSFYFLAALKLFLVFPGSDEIRPAIIAQYFMAALVAVFMDGYTYIMFASGASIMLAWQILKRPDIRHLLIKQAVPVHALAFAASYLLYSLYIGRSSYSAHSLDFFRGWGLDLSFAIIPTKGTHWIPDLLGLSMRRSSVDFYGDTSVRITTFMLPVMLAGLVSWWCARKHMKFAAAALMVAVFGFWMAMGPSVKFDSTKPAGYTAPDMPKSHALMSTGNDLISKYLPGFKVMRAAYRWSALAVFAFWLLVVMNISSLSPRANALWGVLVLLMIVLNMPDPSKILQLGRYNRAEFYQIDKDLVDSLKQHVKQNELVAFVPFSNDLTLNYVASAIGVRTYNIGGDKNLAIAKEHWPIEMLQMNGKLTEEKAVVAKKMLFEGKADTLVVPYFEMIATSFLRCKKEPGGVAAARMPSAFLNTFANCPRHRKAARAQFVASFSEDPHFNVTDADNFTVIRLRPEFAAADTRSTLGKALYQSLHYPIATNKQFSDGAFVLGTGWHDLENEFVWSRAESSLTLPVPEECAIRKCSAILVFHTFGASANRIVSAQFKTRIEGNKWIYEKPIDSEALQQVRIPLDKNSALQTVYISLPEATSPSALQGTADERVLGIGLHEIGLEIHP